MTLILLYNLLNQLLDLTETLNVTAAPQGVQKPEVRTREGEDSSWSWPQISPSKPATICTTVGNVFIGPRYTWGPIYGSQCLKLTLPSADLTDVTLADEDTNSILADNANKGNPRQCGNASD